MNDKPTNLEKNRKLPWNVAAFSANAVFIQFTFFGPVFVLFLKLLGANKTQIGFLLSSLPFAGVIAVFIAPFVVQYGYKRIFLAFWGIRKGVTVGLLLTPMVLSRFGPVAAVHFVGGIIIMFSICRAIAETAYYPWFQEFVPSSIIGKYYAVFNIIVGVSSFLAVTIASVILGPAPGLNNFMLLFAIAVPFGIISVWASSFTPGGRPSKETRLSKASYSGLLSAFTDRNLLFFVIGSGLVTLATVPIASFLPLFLEESVGLNSRDIVFLQNGVLIGGLITGYLWGWAADRYGSKPIMLLGVHLTVFLPFFWIGIPRYSSASMAFAMGISFLQGLAMMSWAIGSNRLFFVSVVPSEKKSEYTALFYAWIGLCGGLGQFLAGWMLDHYRNLSGQIWLFSLDSYLLLFMSSFALSASSLIIFSNVRSEIGITVGQFAGMFFRGNLLLAMESLISFQFAHDERSIVYSTERLGYSRSPLTVEELLEALSDPRFYVRFEAIVSIARRNPDDRFINALIQVLEESEPALSVIAAWALGRIGDRRALEPLRRGLDANYRSIRAHCAHSLGSLGDQQSAPILLEKMKQEEDIGLLVAFASSLGKLKSKAAIYKILEILPAILSEDTRMEVAFALALILGKEHAFIQLHRRTKIEPGTAISQSMRSIRKKSIVFQAGGIELIKHLDESAEAFAHQDMDYGLKNLLNFLRLFPLDQLGTDENLILQECISRLEEFGLNRMEYLLLILHVLNLDTSPSWSSANP